MATAPKVADHTSLKWVRDLFDLFKKPGLLDQDVGQDALYVAVKMSEADRDTLMRVLKRLYGGQR